MKDLEFVEFQLKCEHGRSVSVGEAHAIAVNVIAVVSDDLRYKSLFVSIRTRQRHRHNITNLETRCRIVRIAKHFTSPNIDLTRRALQEASPSRYSGLSCLGTSKAKDRTAQR